MKCQLMGRRRRRPMETDGLMTLEAHSQLATYPR